MGGGGGGGILALSSCQDDNFWTAWHNLFDRTWYGDA